MMPSHDIEISVMIQGPLDWTDEQQHEIEFVSCTSINPFEIEVLDAFVKLQSDNANEIEYQNALRVGLVKRVTTVDEDGETEETVTTVLLDAIDSKLFGKAMAGFGFVEIDEMLKEGVPVSAPAAGAEGDGSSSADAIDHCSSDYEE